MKTARTSQTEAPTRERWRSAVEDGLWDHSPDLADEERDAILVLKSRRFRLGRRCAKRNRPQHQALERLLAPLQAAVDVADCRAESGRVAIFVILDECARAGASFWGWDDDHWVEVLGKNSRAFTARHEVAIAQDVRVVVAAIGVLLDCFDCPNVLRRLGRFQRRTLADKVFGRDAMEAVGEEIAGPLRKWGYVIRVPLKNAIYDALLCNRSPRLVDLTAEVLDELRRPCSNGTRTSYFQIARALAALGYLDKELPLAPPRSGFQREDLTQGVAPTWAEWVERWTATSTLKSRRDIRFHLLKMGRWLQRHHPEITEPQQ